MCTFKKCALNIIKGLNYFNIYILFTYKFKFKIIQKMSEQNMLSIDEFGEQAADQDEMD